MIRIFHLLPAQSAARSERQIQQEQSAPAKSCSGRRHREYSAEEYLLQLRKFSALRLNASRPSLHNSCQQTEIKFEWKCRWPPDEISTFLSIEMHQRHLAGVCFAWCPVARSNSTLSYTNRNAQNRHFIGTNK